MAMVQYNLSFFLFFLFFLYKNTVLAQRNLKQNQAVWSTPNSLYNFYDADNH